MIREKKKNNKIIDGQMDNVICRADVHKKKNMICNIHIITTSV